MLADFAQVAPQAGQQQLLSAVAVGRWVVAGFAEARAQPYQCQRFAPVETNFLGQLQSLPAVGNGGQRVDVRELGGQLA